MKKRIMFIISLISIILASCAIKDPAFVEIANIENKTKNEIIEIYKNKEVNLVFISLPSTDFPVDTFIKYNSVKVGDFVKPNSNVEIVIAGAVDESLLPTLTGTKNITYTKGQPIPSYLTGVKGYDIYEGNLVVTFDDSNVNYQEVGVYQVTYKTTNTSNYSKYVTINVTVLEDIEKPVILGLEDKYYCLVGDAPFNFKSGLTITDNADGIIDLTNLTIDDSLIDYTTVGSYIVSLNVSDKAGNTLLSTFECVVLEKYEPTIYGAEDVSVNVQLPNQPVGFNITDGITAKGYKGNDISIGTFLLVESIKNSSGIGINEIDFHIIDVYEVTYYCLDSTYETRKVRYITVLVPPFDTRYTDELTLDFSYYNKNFLTDGIGVATVVTFTDGDTTTFKVAGTNFVVRYLGIDSPEATSKYDPWGIAAGTFVREKLANAYSIVLQADPDATARTDSNNRYLAYVWYQSNSTAPLRNLNLELIETAYAFASGSHYYSSIFSPAASKTQLTGRRIHGETDPDYDYSSTGIPVTITELLANFAEYSLKTKVLVEGIITFKIENSVFLEDENGKGIYLYCGYNLTNELYVGLKVVIQGLLPQTFEAGGGAKQLSNYSYRNMTVIPNPDTENGLYNVSEMIEIIDNANLLGNYSGNVIIFKELTITGTSALSGTTYAYTIYCVDKNNVKVDIRVSTVYGQNILPKGIIDEKIGLQINITGPVQDYYNGYQILFAPNNIEYID